MCESSDWYELVPAGQDRTHRTLLVVDEATDLFDNLDRDKARSDSNYRALFRFLRLSRHAHIDVLFICQDLNAINSRLRGLVGGVWRSVDMKDFRFGNLFRLPFPFDIFLLQKFDRYGKVCLHKEWVRKDPRVFDLYESEAFGDQIGVKWDGVAVSQEAGKVLKQKGALPMWAKVAAGLSLIFSMLSLGMACKTVDKPLRVSVVTNVVERVAAASTEKLAKEPEPVRVVRQVERGEYVPHCWNNVVEWVEFRGNRYEVGQPCEWGWVRAVDFKGVSCESDDGRTITVLLPGVEAAERRRVVSGELAQGEQFESGVMRRR